MADIKQGYARLAGDPALQLRFPPPVPRAPNPLAGSSGLEFAGDLFWVVVAAIVLALVAVGVQAVRKRGLPRLPQAPAGSAAAPDAVHLPRAALADADALAASGQHGAAVHALLLRGVGVVQDRFPQALGPALTSRDIAASAALPPAFRTAFAGIAARAEQAVFAQAPLGVQDWEACRALYAGLLQPAPP